MKKFWVKLKIYGASFFLSSVALSQGELRYDKTTRLSSSEHLLRSHDPAKPDFFDSAASIDLGVDLGIGSDCGRVDFKNTLRSSLSNILDSKYFGDLGKNIIAASPMLATCYFSPTWCAILKHSQLSANFTSQMRLDQCALIDKYTDSRSEDFYRERQTCVRKKIDSEGGDIESAMESCQNVYQQNLTDWSGGSPNSTVETNKLIDSSAKWAGLTSESAKKAVDLAKGFVGDTVVSKGKVSVDFGGNPKNVTPQNYLSDLQKGMRLKVCDDFIPRILSNQAGASEAVISNAEISNVTDSSLDRQSLEAIASLPDGRRKTVCKKYTDTLAVTEFTRNIAKALDVLNVAATNPNLPPERKRELDSKRGVLKEQAEMVLLLERQRNDPINQVVSQVEEEASNLRQQRATTELQSDHAKQRNQEFKRSMMDCSDGILCSSH